MNIEVKNSVKPVDYHKSMKILESRVKEVSNGQKKEFLWILEHSDVYTGGTSSKNIDLLDKNIEIIKTKRGGKYTYHGPGQKVVYFVLNLNKRKKDIRKLVRNVENCIIEVLKDYNIKAFRDKKNVGVWVKKNNKLYKIAAIGIRVKKWIAYHGFSLNVNTDLTRYNKIVPCGIRNKGITSLKEIGVKNFQNIDQVIIKKFLNIFL